MTELILLEIILKNENTGVISICHVGFIVFHHFLVFNKPNKAFFQNFSNKNASNAIEVIYVKEKQAGEVKRRVKKLA